MKTAKSILCIWGQVLLLCLSFIAILVPRYEKYVWVTVGDDKVRPEHKALDGEVRTWYDTPHPGEEYGCRCHAESVD